MGLLVDGIWRDDWYKTADNGGAFKREDAKLRNWVTADGSAGSTGKAGFKAESGRYHLYVSLACPWAHRTLIFRQLKSLQSHIDVSVVSSDMIEHGWTFDPNTGSSGDNLYQSEYMHQIYTKNDSTYTGRVTVPVLWDKNTQQIVSNESADIIRMFNSAFNDITGNTLDFYPAELRKEIDAINAFVYPNINNGVYRCGFATTQQAYKEAYDSLFVALDKIEEILANNKYLVGDLQTEADWRLFTTLIRFDAVYFGHFKCNQRQIDSYPNISNYVRSLYQVAGVAETTNMQHIKRHYYFSHTMINPTQVIPEGPKQDFLAPHNRG
ncbi:glutathione S-transferase family protein [Psychrosphaera sp. 1_MG-2023]|uniref:glutathione S-transferase family protein n=1 Tax=Psychrosphaera sp. 1_MG-2023 TaxID=3062643 RepID=UPI0026E1C92B|nr:glutathione S-transferase family protein [Psychrosphaera sp. 1_MG-2023]MDO6720724.1 glutathione S-transferase family protein [Psychrosphaera sp. 1_MG-2023]